MVTRAHEKIFLLDLGHQQSTETRKTLEMYKDVGMACQKVCKQGRDAA